MTDAVQGSELKPTWASEIWQGCYDDSWKGVIVPDAFRHPAKMSRALLDRIIKTGFERGWWRENDLVADCFGGVGTTGIAASYAGLRSVSVELEPAFVKLCHDNFYLHLANWQQLGSPLPVYLQGDSRRFAALVGSCGGVVTSPPYADQSITSFTDDKARTQELRRQLAEHGFIVFGGKRYSENEWRALNHGRIDGRTTPGAKKGASGYAEQSPGQIGSLPPGDLAAVLTSPPYAETAIMGGGDNIASGRAEMKRTGTWPQRDLGTGQPVGYGGTPGQIGALKAVVTSPPWENQEPSHAQNDTPSRSRLKEHLKMTAAFLDSEYGGSNGQVGNSSGETYWQAVAEVYRQCRLALRPGGVMCLVVKAYVKGGVLIDLPEQTWQLLAALGFEPVTRIRAMLVKERRHAGLFGADVVKRTKRVSFFRRLAEAKGSPRIDYEELLVIRKAELDQKRLAFGAGT